MNYRQKMLLQKGIWVSIISIFALLIFASFGTYALVSIQLTSDKTINIQSGTLSINYNDDIAGNLIVLTNPQTDEDGQLNAINTITINNTGSLLSCYTLSILDDVDTIAGLGSINDVLTYENLRFVYRRGTTGDFSQPMSLADLEAGIIENDTLEAVGGESQVIYQIKVWIDIDAGNEAQGKTYYGKIEVNATQEEMCVVE